MTRILLLSAFALVLASCEVGNIERRCGDTFVAYSCRLRYSYYYGYYRTCVRQVVTIACPDAGTSGDGEPDTVLPPDGTQTVDAGVGSMDEGSMQANTSPNMSGVNEPPDAGLEDSSGGTSSGTSGAPASGGASESGSTSSEGGAASSQGGTPAVGGVGGADPTAVDDPVIRDLPFDFPCEQDTQCGTGICRRGDCFYGCLSDQDCGSGDRCAADSGKLVCMPDAAPPLVCMRNTDCSAQEVCLNAYCTQICATTLDCSNLFDRCLNGLCEPDRRPLVECIFDDECPDDRVCLDGACTVLPGQ